MIILGVVADTHIPDRVAVIPPLALDYLRGVHAILHAGDLCTYAVLQQFEAIAPTYAVKGNRDVFLSLPMDRVLTFEQVRVGLTHGHGGWLGYLREKLHYHKFGYRTERYRQRLRARFQEAQVVVFGHSHRIVNEWDGDCLIFNPGSLGPTFYPPYHRPSLGKLFIEGGTVRGEIVAIPPKIL
jgi:hypothetical protein